MTESLIKTGPGGTVFAGPDAVALYRAMALRSGLRMYARSGMLPNRMWTPSNMLRAAGTICGKTYKRGQYELAVSDLTLWIDAMKLALPVEQCAND